MKSKSVLVIIVLAVIAGIWYLASRGSSQAPATGSTGAAAQSVAPISSTPGSVAGVDLNGLSAQANQSATEASQEGSTSLQSVSADGSTINSSLDSQTAPQ